MTGNTQCTSCSDAATCKTCISGYYIKDNGCTSCTVTYGANCDTCDGTSCLTCSGARVVDTS